MIPQVACQNSNDPRQRIESLGKRIAEHVQFMCAPGTGGTSERLVVVERQLGRIREDLQLE